MVAGSVDILGHNISAVQHAAGHVFSVTRVTLHHLVGRLKAGIGDLSHRQLLVVGLLCGDDVGDQGEVDAGVRHQVGLELCQVQVESSVKAQGCSDSGNNLANEPDEVGVSGTLNVQVATADVIDGLIVHHEGTVRVL